MPYRTRSLGLRSAVGASLCFVAALWLSLLRSVAVCRWSAVLCSVWTHNKAHTLGKGAKGVRCRVSLADDGSKAEKHVKKGKRGSYESRLKNSLSHAILIKLAFLKHRQSAFSVS